VRVEWCKARARKLRWSEEVDLLRKEMHRVQCFLQWRIKWWLSRSCIWPGLDQQVTAGLKAYALRQANLYQNIAESFKNKW
ncbi:hypothetical protein BJ138DRAFT_975570, partial [Hygrophoropsis aurantiaca]